MTLIIITTIIIYLYYNVKTFIITFLYNKINVLLHATYDVFNYTLSNNNNYTMVITYLNN